MRENRTYGLMRGRAYPERDAPPYSTRKSGGVTEFLVNCLPCDAPRNFQTNRYYHLVNRVVHRAFYLDEYEP